VIFFGIGSSAKAVAGRALKQPKRNKRKMGAGRSIGIRIGILRFSISVISSVFASFLGHYSQCFCGEGKWKIVVKKRFRYYSFAAGEGSLAFFSPSFIRCILLLLLGDEDFHGLAYGG
jgi:hypothetical protein